MSNITTILAKRQERIWDGLKKQATHPDNAARRFIYQRENGAFHKQKTRSATRSTEEVYKSTRYVSDVSQGGAVQGLPGYKRDEIHDIFRFHFATNHNNPTITASRACDAMLYKQGGVFSHNHAIDINETDISTQESSGDAYVDINLLCKIDRSRVAIQAYWHNHKSRSRLHHLANDIKALALFSQYIKSGKAGIELAEFRPLDNKSSKSHWKASFTKRLERGYAILNASTEIS